VHTWSVPQLIDLYNRDERKFRDIAVGELLSRPEAAKNPKVVQIMGAAMSDPNFLNRSDALRWILALPNPPDEVIDKVIVMFDISDSDERSSYTLRLPAEDRMAIVKMLGRAHPETTAAVPALIVGLDDLSSDVRLAALVALRSYGEKAAPALPHLAKLIEAYGDDDPVKKEAAETLLTIGRTGRLAARVYYLQRLNDSGRSDSFPDACHAIEIIGPDASEAISPLTKHLTDDDNSRRIEVAAALGGIGPAAARAIPGLLRMMDNGDFDVRQAAASALMKIAPDGQGLGPAIIAAVYNRDQHDVNRLATVVKRPEDITAIMPRLKKLADDDPDPIVQSAARHAIEVLGKTNE
jgi:HEAT repeat protein